jgi:hypothetical protein
VKNLVNGIQSGFNEWFSPVKGMIEECWVFPNKGTKTLIAGTSHIYRKLPQGKIHFYQPLAGK